MLRSHVQKETNGVILTGHGNVLNSRNRALTDSANLRFLLEKRILWMSTHLGNPTLIGVEFGAGAGYTKIICPDSKVLLTDVIDSDWLDVKEVDATRTEFENSSMDYIIVNNVLHHISNPHLFFTEAARILKPGGSLLVQEIHTSLLMRGVLKLLNHESFDDSTDPFSRKNQISDPNNPWDANCDIARQCFDNHSLFESNFQNFKILSDIKTECFTFLNSGGVVVQSPYLRMSRWMSRIIWGLDLALVGLFPNILGLQRQIELVRR